MGQDLHDLQDGKCPDCDGHGWKWLGGMCGACFGTGEVDFFARQRALMLEAQRCRLRWVRRAQARNRVDAPSAGGGKGTAAKGRKEHKGGKSGRNGVVPVIFLGVPSLNEEVVYTADEEIVGRRRLFRPRLAELVGELGARRWWSVGEVPRIT